MKKIMLILLYLSCIVLGREESFSIDIESEVTEIPIRVEVDCQHDTLTTNKPCWALRTKTDDGVETLFHRAFRCDGCNKKIVIVNAVAYPVKNKEYKIIVKTGQIWWNKGNDYDYEILEVGEKYIVYVLAGCDFFLKTEKIEAFLRHHSLTEPESKKERNEG